MASFFAKPVLSMLLLLLASHANASFITVYDNQFEPGSDKVHKDASADLTGGSHYNSQGYSSRGFGDTIYALDYTKIDGLIELNLGNLPTHTHLSISGLLAVINSWDGALGDNFSVFLDGSMLFSTQFLSNEPFGENLTPEGKPTLYTVSTDKPAWGDRAYDFTGFSPLMNVVHSSNTAKISFLAHGSNWQGRQDESYGFGALKVTTSVGNASIKELNASFEVSENGPASFDVSTPLGLSLASLIMFGFVSRRRTNSDH